MRTLTILALTLFLIQAPPPKGVIEGRVIRAGSREPLSDVLVTLVSPLPAASTANFTPEITARLNDQIAQLTERGNVGGIPQDVIDNAIENARRTAGGSPAPQALTAMTDSSGRFSFRDLPPGRYTVRAEREGYFAAPLNGTAPAAVTKTITIQEGKATPPEDLAMVKGSVISGRIRDPNGQPVSGITVTVYRVTYSNGRKLWTAFNSKATDDRGEYRIYWLYPGEFYVGVTPRAVGNIPGPQDSWARTFFPGTAEPKSAMPIEINDGTEVSGVDISIASVASAVFKISGVVSNAAARPNPATGVTDRSISSFILVPREPGVLDAVNPPTVVNSLPNPSRTNGEFELRNVRAGAYDLYPVAPVLTDTVVLAPIGQPIAAPAIRRQPTSRTAIDVNRDITDLRIAVNTGATLSGEVHVNGSGGTAIRLESLRLNLRPLDTTPVSFVSLAGNIPVDASGRFTAANIVEARYAVQVAGLPATAYVFDIRQGGTSVMDRGIVIDQSATPIEVVVDPNGVTVQGTVMSADGKPAVNATVALVPPTARQENLLLYRNAVTNEAGVFTLRGAAPGPYTIFAWESVIQGAWQNAEFLSRYEGRGRQVIISAGSVAEVQLSVIP